MEVFKENIEDYDLFKKNESALLIYSILTIVYLVSIIFELDILQLVVKPIMLPLLVYYYVDKLKKKTSIIVLLIYLSFYIPEMLNLISIEYFKKFNLILFIIPYLLFSCYLFKGVRSIQSKSSKMVNLMLLAVSIILIYLIFTILSTIEHEGFFEFIIYILYSILLMYMILVSAYRFLNSTDVFDFFLLLAVINMVISDIFFVFLNKIENEMAFLIINVFTQSLSYLFLTKYFVAKAEKKRNLQIVVPQN